MPVSATVILQGLAIVLQILNGFNVMALPTKWQYGFTAVLAGLQGLQGVIAHYYTPAGTSLNAPGTTVTTATAGTVPAK